MVDNIFKSMEVVRAVEVRTSVERRRRWSAEEKGRIVAASFAPGANASDVARQHDISPQHLFQWRHHAAKAGRLVLPLDDDVMFAPVVLDRQADGRARSGVEVEVEVAGAVIRVRAQTDLQLVAAIARALQAAS
jgi:transposase